MCSKACQIFPKRLDNIQIFIFTLIQKCTWEAPRSHHNQQHSGCFKTDAGPGGEGKPIIFHSNREQNRGSTAGPAPRPVLLPHLSPQGPPERHPRGERGNSQLPSAPTLGALRSRTLRTPPASCHLFLQRAPKNTYGSSWFF